MERQIERQIVQYVDSLHGLALKLVLASEQGFPDRTILLPGKQIAFLEVKQPGGRISANQDKWLKRLRDMGFTAEAVFSLAKATEVLSDI